MLIQHISTKEVEQLIECCGNCKHYNDAYCSIMDELVEPEDNCGMCNTEGDVE